MQTSLSRVPEVCGLCRRPLGEALIEEHHLLPKELGGRETVRIHKICHRKIHATFSNRELLHVYHTFESLRAHPEIARFIAWLNHKPPSFYDHNAPTQALRRRYRR